MRYIRTTNNLVEFVEVSNEDKILSVRAFDFGELYFQIKNGKVTFYLNDQENPWRNDVWTINIPFELDGVEYDNEDDASAALSAIMNDSFQEQLDELKVGLAAETARAQQAEEDLGEEIDDERNRAISAETHLQSEVTELSGFVSTFDERITTVEEGLSALTETVNDEITRSTAKDTEHDALISGLTNVVNSEIQRALSAETTLHGDIVNEQNRAITAESGITVNLNAEVSRSTTKDTQHDTQISALTTNLQNEIQRATEAENSLRDDLDTEIANRISGDTNLQNQINTLGNRVSNDEARLSAEEAKNAEQDAAISGLNNSLNTEIQRATAAENSLRNDLNTETQNRISGDTNLQNQINAEVLRSTNKDTEHDNLISALTDDLAAETAARIAADNALGLRIDNETAARISGDTNLQNQITTEVTRSTAEDARLSQLIDDEVTRATNAESTLTNSLNNEIARATSAETVLHDEILAERNRALNAESGITVSLNNEIARATAVESGLTADVTRIDGILPTKADKANAVASAEYVSANKIINFKNIDGAVISSINATDFIKDGMVDDVEIKVISGASYLAITFNSDAGKEEIDIPLTDIFNPNNYYTKVEIDASQLAQDNKIGAISGDVITLNTKVNTISGDIITVSGQVQTVSGMVEDIDLTPYATKDYVSGYTYDKQTIDDKIAQGGSFDPTQYYNKTATDALLAQKQNTLIAGSGIAISSNNVISATGGSTPVDAYTKAESDARFQQKLTAGNGISIVNNVISATGGSSTLDVAISGGTDDASHPLAIIYNHPSNVASGRAANAFGVGTKANGVDSIAVGAYTEANGFASFAGGDSAKTNSTASESFAYGKEVETSNIGEAAFGIRNKSNREVNGSIEVSSGCTLFSIGNSHSIQDRDNALEIRKDDSIYIVKTPSSNTREVVKLQDYLTDTSAFTAHTSDTAIHLTSGDVQTQINSSISGKTIDSLSAGTNVQINNGVISATDTKYTAGRAIDITNNNISLKIPISAATGNNSIVEGDSTKATGFSSHAEGDHTEAKGNRSHAEGFYAKAIGTASHAEGDTTNASGGASHAEGEYTTASGDCSHTEGKNTKALNEAEHASGKFNVSSKASTTFGNSGNTLFSVGNGTSNDARHNAFEIKQNGNIYIADTKASGEFNEKPLFKLQDKLEEIDNKQSQLTAGSGITISNNVISAKIWSGTQLEYDALQTYSNDTIYLIYES